jgi:hypothetical protein
VALACPALPRAAHSPSASMLGQQDYIITSDSMGTWASNLSSAALGALLLVSASLPSLGPPHLTAFTELLVFEENQGQTDPQVQFLARGAGYRFFLSGGGIVLALQPAPRRPFPSPGTCQTRSHEQQSPRPGYVRREQRVGATAPHLTSTTVFSLGPAATYDAVNGWDTVPTNGVPNIWVETGPPGYNGPAHADAAIDLSIGSGTGGGGVPMAGSPGGLTEPYHGINLFFNGSTTPQISASQPTACGAGAPFALRRHFTEFRRNDPGRKLPPLRGGRTGN